MVWRQRPISRSRFGTLVPVHAEKRDRESRSRDQGSRHPQFRYSHGSLGSKGEQTQTGHHVARRSSTAFARLMVFSAVGLDLEEATQTDIPTFTGNSSFATRPLCRCRTTPRSMTSSINKLTRASLPTNRPPIDRTAAAILHLTIRVDPLHTSPRPVGQ